MPEARLSFSPAYYENAITNNSSKEGTVPARVFTGISFRTDPHPPSLQKIKEICAYYERKCGGKVSPNSNIGRLLFDLSRDVQAVTSELMASRKERLDMSENAECLLKEWTEEFGPFSVNDPKALTPQLMLARYKETQSRNRRLVQEKEAMQREMIENEKKLESTLDQHCRVARNQYSSEVARLQTQFHTHLEASQAQARARLQVTEDMYNEKVIALKNKQKKILAEEKQKLSIVSSSSKSELVTLRDRHLQLGTIKSDIEKQLVQSKDHLRHETNKWKSRERELLVRAMAAESMVKEIKDRSTDESTLMACLAESERLRDELNESRKETSDVMDRAEGLRRRASELQETVNIMQQAIQQLQGNSLGVDSDTRAIWGGEEVNTKADTTKNVNIYKDRTSAKGIDVSSVIKSGEEEGINRRIDGLDHMLYLEHGELAKAWRERKAKLFNQRKSKQKGTRRKRNQSIDEVQRRARGSFNPEGEFREPREVITLEELPQIPPAINPLPERFHRGDEVNSRAWRGTLRGT